jgi:hypothetical protein
MITLEYKEIRNKVWIECSVVVVHKLCFTVMGVRGYRMANDVGDSEKMIFVLGEMFNSILFSCVSRLLYRETTHTS